MKLSVTQKNLIVFAGVTVVILLLVWIIGPGRIRNVFDSKKTEHILQLKDQIRQDSLRIITLQALIKIQQDSVFRYKDLYNLEKTNYKVITKYYEKKMVEVKGMTSKETIDYFESQTQCEDSRDTIVMTRLSNLSCANVKFVERETFLAQRDTLYIMNKTLENEIGSYADMTLTQQELIDMQKSSIGKFLDMVTTQETMVADLQKEKKKTDKKIKRIKTMTIITASAAVVLGAVLILQ